MHAHHHLLINRTADGRSLLSSWLPADRIYFLCKPGTMAITAVTRYEVFCHPLYLVAAGGLNLPNFAFGVLGNGCPYYSSWLVINGILGLFNMIAAVYIVYKIRMSTRPNAESSSEDAEKAVTEEGEVQEQSYFDESINEVVADNTRTPETRPRTWIKRLLKRRTISSDRIRQLVCYDGVVATYSILFLFWVAWLSEGTQRMRHYDNATEDETNGCSHFHERYVETSLICGYSYMICVVVALLASLWS
jgi:hypothetical protein